MASRKFKGAIEEIDKSIIWPDWERAMMEWNNHVIEHRLDADAAKHLQDIVRARHRRKKRSQAQH